MTQERLGTMMAAEAEKRRAMGSHHSRHSNTTTWLTPPNIVGELGPFDLDPCAAPPGRPWDCAYRSICLPEDGLAADWNGQYVWLNPPYGPPPVIRPWMYKAAQHGNSGGSGIALVFARTETAVFYHYVWSQVHPMTLLFLTGRLHFYDMQGRPASANAGAPSVLIAWGKRGIDKLTEAYIDGKLTGGLVQRR